MPATSASLYWIVTVNGSVKLVTGLPAPSRASTKKAWPRTLRVGDTAAVSVRPMVTVTVSLTAPGGNSSVVVVVCTRVTTPPEGPTVAVTGVAVGVGDGVAVGVELGVGVGVKVGVGVGTWRRRGRGVGVSGVGEAVTSAWPSGRSRR